MDFTYCASRFIEERKIESGTHVAKQTVVLCQNLLTSREALKNKSRRKEKKSEGKRNKKEKELLKKRWDTEK